MTTLKYDTLTAAQTRWAGILQDSQRRLDEARTRSQTVKAMNNVARARRMVCRIHHQLDTVA